MIILDYFNKRNFFPQILITAIAIFVVSYLLRGIQVDGIVAALIAALLLGLVNSFVRPFLVVFSIPLNIITLGLFTFIINAIMLLLTAWLVPGFVVSGFWTAVLGSILISIFTSLISAIFQR